MKYGNRNSIQSFAHSFFLEKGYYFSYIKYSALALICSVIAFGSGLLPYPYQLAILVVILIIPAILSVIAFPISGFYFILILSYSNNFFNKFIPLPFGLSVDALISLIFLILLTKLVSKRDFEVFKHPISLMLLFWIGYCLLQVLNPWADSTLGWLVGIRMTAIYHVTPILLALTLVNLRQVKQLLFTIILLSTVTALYGLKQEFLGFAQMELNWLYADPIRFNLIVIWERFRTFSVFSDPTTFGIVMSLTACLCIGLSLQITTGKWKKIILWLLALLMLINMFYSGARTPFIILPAGIALMFWLRSRIWELLVVGLCLFIAGFWVYKSTNSNPIISRVQSAFYPTQDASFQVRLDNQNIIQPYILRHPIGGGIGSTGLIGQRFSPHTQLGNFPPDSYYVQIAVETGIIGLLIYLILLWTIFKNGVHGFFNSRNPQVKTLYLTFAILIFMITIANYPQQTILFAPINMIYYFIIGMIIRMNFLDGHSLKIEQT